ARVPGRPLKERLYVLVGLLPLGRSQSVAFGAKSRAAFFEFGHEFAGKRSGTDLFKNLLHLSLSRRVDNARASRRGSIKRRRRDLIGHPGGAMVQEKFDRRFQLLAHVKE